MKPNQLYDLECVNVAKNFGSFRAVNDVSFNIPSGSFFSILGPSGCGKTTLMRMIAGFEEPAAGDIKIKGKSVLGLPPNRRNVKMVFQHLALFPMLNIFENIAYGLRCNGFSNDIIQRKVRDVLERVALPGVGNREVHQLSGGQKQRIAIARCMVLDPDVLLLDALDLKLREAMKIELKQLQHQFNTTFVYITHDQSEALMMSDNVAIMKEGQFEQIGTPQELYHDPRTSFVAGFVGDSNRWSGRVVTSDMTGGKVETDQGLNLSYAAPKSNGIDTGSKVDIFVRPEFITVERENAVTNGQNLENAMVGKVDSLLFNGANSRILVRPVSGELIEADVVLTGQDDPKPGDAVRLSWSSSQALCFAQTAGQR